MTTYYRVFPHLGVANSQCPLPLQPWEPECYYPDFPHEVVCGDSWGDARIIAATQEGVYVLDGEQA